MIPIRNGVIIGLPEYTGVHRADVYEIGNVWVFILNPHRYRTIDSRIDCRHADVKIGNGMQRKLDSGHVIIIVPKMGIYVRQYHDWNDNEVWIREQKHEEDLKAREDQGRRTTADFPADEEAAREALERKAQA